MNTALSASHSETAFYRNRKAMLMYPVIVLPFIAALFWLGRGGKGERYLAQQAAGQQAGSGGFNANMPNAKSGSIDGRDVDGPGYGKAPVGQMLSTFTKTRHDSISRGLTAIPANNPSGMQSAAHASSLGTPSLAGSTASQPINRSNTAAIAATSYPRSKARKGYYYNAPGYSASATDQQLESQLRTYESSRTAKPAMTYNRPEAPVQPHQPEVVNSTGNAATVRVSDQLTASRLSEPLDAESPFLTAPTGGSRTQPTRAVLSGGNYGSKKTIAWMIPVVVHDDQAIHDGQQVKLRLLKEITADGVTVPTNTILYAICQLSDNRLRLTVRSLQLGGQLIPLDLDVYDTDGSAGINVPGLSNSSQVGGQLRSSAIQGVQVPGIGGLGNTVLNSARMGASNSVRQATIRLRAGYNLFLKAQ